MLAYDLVDLIAASFSTSTHSCTPCRWLACISTIKWFICFLICRTHADLILELQTNPFTSYVTETNSQGVITGHPKVSTSQVAAVTSQPSVITSEPTVITSEPTVITSEAVAATSPAGPAVIVTSTFATAIGTGVAPVSGSNTTVSTQSVPSSATKASGSSGATGVAAGTSGSSTAAATTASHAGAGMVQPVLGLGFAGAMFAAFL